MGKGTVTIGITDVLEFVLTLALIFLPTIYVPSWQLPGKLLLPVWHGVQIFVNSTGHSVAGYCMAFLFLVDAFACGVQYATYRQWIPIDYGIDVYTGDSVKEYTKICLLGAAVLITMFRAIGMLASESDELRRQRFAEKQRVFSKAAAGMQHFVPMSFPMQTPVSQSSPPPIIINNPPPQQTFQRPYPQMNPYPPPYYNYQGWN